MSAIRRRLRKGYSLIETMVAAVILMIGVSAATTLSLTMTTQEEIAWRVARGMNLLENAATLYQLGMDADGPLNYLPLDPAVTLSVDGDTETDDTVLDLGLLRGVTYRVTIDSVEDVGAWSEGTWTGGSDTTSPQRVVEARAYRTSIDLF